MRCERGGDASGPLLLGGPTRRERRGLVLDRDQVSGRFGVAHHRELVVDEVQRRERAEGALALPRVVEVPTLLRVQAGDPDRELVRHDHGLVAAGGVGTARYLMGTVSFDLLSLVVNLVWAVFDLVILSVVISAARCTTGPRPSSGRRGD